MSKTLKDMIEYLWNDPKTLQLVYTRLSDELKQIKTKIKELDTIDLLTKLQVCKELLEMVRDENE